MKVNLISVGQLCDNELMVMFTKDNCKVKMIVAISYVVAGLVTNNAYLNLILHTMSIMLTVQTSSANRYKDLVKLTKLDAIRERPKGVCGSC